MATNLAEIMAERSRLNKDLLLALVHAVARNERTQDYFRIAVLPSLSKIEVMVGMLLAAQTVEADYSKPVFVDKVNKYAEETQEYVSRHSKELGLKMVKYVYDHSELQTALPKTRRRRSQNVSYDI
jgi:hypothetical protein